MSPVPRLVAARHIVVSCVEYPGDRKSTRLNSSHDQISYAVFCLKKKKKKVLKKQASKSILVEHQDVRASTEHSRTVNQSRQGTHKQIWIRSDCSDRRLTPDRQYR